MAEHIHEFGDPRTVPIGSARMCRGRVGEPGFQRDCLKWGVRHRGRVAWEDPTVDELIGLIAHMIEATAIGEAMVLIHGREHGIQRARQALGYPP